MYLAKLLDFLRIKRAIWIKLSDGTIELTWISNNTPFGKQAYIFPTWKMGSIILNEDSDKTTSGTSYIHNWEYYRK